MDFCGNNGDGTPAFTSSVIGSNGGGSDPDITKWGARRLNLSMRDVQATIQEGRAARDGRTIAWSIEGNSMLRMNN